MEEHLQSKLKDFLKNDNIKLWDPPYTTENNEIGRHSMKELAGRYATALHFPASDVENALETVRSQAVKRGKGNSVYKQTQVATVELILPRDKKKDLKDSRKKNYFETRLDVTVQDVIHRISEEYELKHIKLILQGKLLTPEKMLYEQNVKHNSKVMVLQSSEPERQQSIMQEEEKKRCQDESVRRTEKGFHILSERDGSEDPETTPYLEIADQKGNPLKIPPNEKKALILAMGFHEKGRALMKKKNHEFALCHLLEADEYFKKCGSSFLNTVDNYAVLQLDIVWCYQELKALDCLHDSKLRLDEAELYFIRCYGEQKERLLQIKGNTGREEVLFLRLYLLQSLLAYLSGNEKYAAVQMEKVENLYRQLQLDPNKVTELMSLGYSAQEARLGLRASLGDTNAAALHISQRREEKAKIKEQEREKRRKRVEAISTLQELGYSRAEAAKALHEAQGNLDAAFNILLDARSHAEVANNNTEMGDYDPGRPEKIDKLVYLGFSRDAAEVALRRTMGDIQRASELLLDSNSILLPEQQSPSSPSSSSEEPSTSSESAATGSTGEDPMDVDLVSEVLDDIPAHEEDYLDITLEEESVLIAQMKSYLQPHLEEN